MGYCDFNIDVVKEERRILQTCLPYLHFVLQGSQRIVFILLHAHLFSCLELAIFALSCWLGVVSGNGKALLKWRENI